MFNRAFFTGFIFLLALQRLFEFIKSEKNRRFLLKNGGREHGKEHFSFMVLLHFCWLLSMMLEVWLLKWPIFFTLSIFAGSLFFVGQALRLFAMHQLKRRWTARIITVPGLPPITSGIFRYFRHPNYLGVILEVAAAPLIHSAFLTAIGFSILNLLLLKVRISKEEIALDKDNDYRRAFALN